MTAPKLRQWLIDMTGPEDAFARSQYAAMVVSMQNASRWIEETATNDDEGAREILAVLRMALKNAGERPCELHSFCDAYEREGE